MRRSAELLCSTTVRISRGIMRPLELQLGCYKCKCHCERVRTESSVHPAGSGQHVKAKQSGWWCVVLLALVVVSCLIVPIIGLWFGPIHYMLTNEASPTPQSTGGSPTQSPTLQSTGGSPTQSPTL